MAGKPWTTKEIEKVKKEYPFKGKGLTIQGRSLNAIHEKAEDLEIRFIGNPTPDKRAVDEKDFLKTKVLTFVKGRQRTLNEICSYLDKGPTTVKTLLQELQDAHYNVSIKGDDNVILENEPQRQHKPFSLNVEKYFGSSREVIFGVTSDKHYANQHCREELVDLAYDIFKKEGVGIVFDSGNMVDGELALNRYELVASGVEGQTQYLIKHSPKVEGIVTYYITASHHENWAPKNIGLNYGTKLEDDMKRSGRNDWVYLGYVEADVAFKTKAGNCSVRLCHPRTGNSYALSYQSQKIIESYSGGEKPHVLLLGHFHKLAYLFIRNIHTLLCGTFEDQTVFLREHHIESQLGFWIVRMTLAEDGTVLKFVPQCFPFFDKTVYQNTRDYTEDVPRIKEKEIIKPIKVF